MKRSKMKFAGENECILYKMINKEESAWIFLIQIEKCLE